MLYVLILLMFGSLNVECVDYELVVGKSVFTLSKLMCLCTLTELFACVQ